MCDAAGSSGARPQARAQDSLHPWLQLQRRIGNRNVTSLLQPDVVVEPPGTHQEREAERAAAEVSAGTAQAHKPLTMFTDRPANGNGPAGHDVMPPVARPWVDTRVPFSDHGQALPLALRQRMEHALSADFSTVRVHTGPHPHQWHKALHARAFTLGEHIHFAPGEDNLLAVPGQALLAHELTHVLQQRSRQPSSSNPLHLQCALSTNYASFATAINNTHDLQLTRIRSELALYEATIAVMPESLDVLRHLETLVKLCGEYGQQQSYSKQEKSALDDLVEDLKDSAQTELEQAVLERYEPLEVELLSVAVQLLTKDEAEQLKVNKPVVKSTKERNHFLAELMNAIWEARGASAIPLMVDKKLIGFIDKRIGNLAGGHKSEDVMVIKETWGLIAGLIKKNAPQPNVSPVPSATAPTMTAGGVPAPVTAMPVLNRALHFVQAHTAIELTASARRFPPPGITPPPPPMWNLNVTYISKSDTLAGPGCFGGEYWLVDGTNATPQWTLHVHRNANGRLRKAHVKFRNQPWNSTGINLDLSDVILAGLPHTDTSRKDKEK